MNQILLPEGLWPVMLTPFTFNGSIDYPSLDRLIEFYLDQGASGLFANCLSSEMYHLKAAERTDLVSHVVKRVKGRVPVVATGTFGMNPDTHIHTIKAMNNLGTAAVVMVSSQLAGISETDEILKNKIQRILEKTDSIPLGMYECPDPYKRLLGPEMVEYLAQTHRFLYYKETSCHPLEIKTKLSRIQNTPLGLFNANTPTALDSLKDGASGLSTIAANFYPELFTRLCEWGKSPVYEKQAASLQKHLSLMDAVTRIKYPLNAKIFLSKRGLKINDFTRVKVPRLHFEEEVMLDALFEHFKVILEKFHLNK